VSVYRKHGSAIFSFDFIIKGHRFSGSTGCTSEREAKRFEALEREKARDQVKAMSEATVSLKIDHVAERYWQAVGQHHAGADTTARDLARLVQYFGRDKLIVEITDADVTKLVAWRRGHRRTVHRRQPSKTQEPLIAPATVNRSTTEVLKKLFTFVKRREGLQFKREPDWKQHRLAEPEERVRELQRSEADAIDATMREDFAPLLDFVAASGMRQREAVLLRWSEVDFFGARRITKIGKGGKRISFPITPSVREIIFPLQGHHSEFVFTYTAQRTSKRAGIVKGERYPMTLSGLKTYWRRLRVEAGVEGFRFHDYRHDFATKLLRKTGNLKLVQRALNHRNIKTTLKYAHVLDDEIASAIEAVAQDRQRESCDVESHQIHTERKKTG
jgi:integrase